MTNFQKTITAVISDHHEGRGVGFAAASKISRSALSKLLSARRRPDHATLENICRGHQPDVAAQLAVAHMHDECPQYLRPRITIKPTVEKPSSADTTALDKKTRAAVLFLAHYAITSPEMREHLRSQARLMGAQL